MFDVCIIIWVLLDGGQMVLSGFRMGPIIRIHPRLAFLDMFQSVWMVLGGCVWILWLRPPDICRTEKKTNEPGATPIRWFSFCLKVELSHAVL